MTRYQAVPDDGDLEEVEFEVLADLEAAVQAIWGQELEHVDFGVEMIEGTETQQYVFDVLLDHMDGAYLIEWIESVNLWEQPDEVLVAFSACVEEGYTVDDSLAHAQAHPAQEVVFDGDEDDVEDDEEYLTYEFGDGVYRVEPIPEYDGD